MTEASFSRILSSLLLCRSMHNKQHKVTWFLVSQSLTNKLYSVHNLIHSNHVSKTRGSIRKELNFEVQSGTGKTFNICDVFIYASWILYRLYNRIIILKTVSYIQSRFTVKEVNVGLCPINIVCRLSCLQHFVANYE